MFLWITEPTNLVALYTVRLSITLFFLRLIPKHMTLYRRIIFGFIWSLTISIIYVTVIQLIECRPTQKAWDPTIEGECLSNATYQAAPWIYQGTHSKSYPLILGGLSSYYIKLTFCSGVDSSGYCSHVCFHDDVPYTAVAL